MVRFIESAHHEPNKCLQIVVLETNSTKYEGCAGIDSLYSQILLHAFSDVHEPEVFANLRNVLGAILLAFNPLSRKELSTILGVSTTLISTTLRHLHSVVLVPTDESKEIRVFHKSFPDFLQDGKRCTNPRFSIDPTAHHSDMALKCLELVKKLERNPCSLPPYIMNQDVVDLSQLLEDKIGDGMKYACIYWARHLRLSPTSGHHYIKQAICSVTNILQNAPPWIEVMSLESCLEEAVHSTQGLIDWLTEVSGSVYYLTGKELVC